MADEPQPYSRTNRRAVLRGLAATGGVVAVSGLGAADGNTTTEAEARADIKARDALQRRYDQPSAVRGAIVAQATGVLRELAAQGVLDSPSVAALPLDNRLAATTVRPESTSEGVGVTTATVDGTITALLMVSVNTDANGVGVYVLPEVGDSYALVRPTDGSAGSKVSSGDDDVTTSIVSDCSTSTECDESICHGDSSMYCTHTYYPENTYECCRGTGCTLIGTSSCFDGCHYKNGPLCCCL